MSRFFSCFCGAVIALLVALLLRFSRQFFAMLWHCFRSVIAMLLRFYHAFVALSVIALFLRCCMLLSRYFCALACCCRAVVAQLSHSALCKVFLSSSYRICFVKGFKFFSFSTQFIMRCCSFGMNTGK